MSEMMGPSPEEMGEEPEPSVEEFEIADIKAKQELLVQLNAEGIDIRDPETRYREGLIQEEVPLIPLDPNEPEYNEKGEPLATAEGIFVWRAKAMERFTFDKCRPIMSYRILDASFTPSMVCKLADNTFATVSDMRLEKDALFDKGKKKTKVVLDVRDSGGQVSEVETALPLYMSNPRPELNEQFPGQIEIERDGEVYRVGDKIEVPEVQEYIGRVALILDQNEFPGQIGVMLRDRKSRSRLWVASLEDIKKVG
jgi:hypothetical protein